MAWSTSFMHRQQLADILDKTLTTHDFDASSMFKVALYDNSVTPDPDATAVASSYNGAGSTFVATGGATGSAQVYHTGQWAQAGEVLVGNDITVAAGGIVVFDANNLSSGTAATMSNIYGCYIYFDAVTTPVADQGFAAIYFGGTAYTVSAGTFSIEWSASGIARWDVAP